MDISPKEASCKFWVTPLCEGKIEGAEIEIWHENKKLDAIEIHLEVLKQKPAKFAMICGFIAPILSVLYDMYSATLQKKAPALLKHALKWIEYAADFVGGISHLGLGVGLLLMLLALILYFARKTKQAKPVVDILDCEI